MKGFPFLVEKVTDTCNESEFAGVCAYSIISQIVENKHRDRAGNRRVHLLGGEIQVSGEVDLTGKNFLINSKRVVIKKWRKPVAERSIYF